MLLELTNYRKQLEKTMHWLKRRQYCVRKPSKKKYSAILQSRLSNLVQALFAATEAANAIRWEMNPRPSFNVGSAHVGHDPATVGKTGNEQITMRGDGAVIVEPQFMKGKMVAVNICKQIFDGDVYAPNCKFNFDKCTVGAELKHPDRLRHSIAMNIKTQTGNI